MTLDGPGTSYRYRKPPILGRIRTDRHAVIEASAGTGKTYTLEHLVIELVVERDASIDEILVVTFTEKATREMRQRVRRKIEHILAGLPSTEIDPPPDVPAWLVDDEARSRLRRALFAFDRAPISTIHAFCQRVLTEHAFDSHRLFEQEQVEARQSFGRAFRDELRVVLAEPGPLSAVTLDAIAAVGVRQIEDDLFKISCERGVIEPCYDEARFGTALLALPSARALEGRLGEVIAGMTRVGDKCVQSLAGLIDVRERLGREEGVGALRAVWEWSEVAVGSSSTNLAYLLHHLPKLADDADVGPVLDALRAIADAAATRVAFLAHDLLPRVRDRLGTTKRRRGQMDFDDMLVLVRDAVSSERGRALVSELRSRYRWALVDEFQDTDEVQWTIFREVFFDSPDGHVLFVIGDPKQAIYSFRGADVYTYHDAAQTIRAGGGVVVPLEDNYRSTSAVIDGYNRILESGFFTEPNRYDHPVRVGNPSLGLVDRDGQGAPGIVLWRVSGEPMKLAALSALYAEHVAREITALLGGEVRLASRGELRRLRASDVHVLTRTDREARTVGDALRRHGIPHAFFKQDGLFQTSEAQDLRALLSALEDPGDPSRRLRVWLTPFFGVLLEDLPRCRDLDPSHPLVERLFRWKALADDLDWGRLFDRVLEESGLVRRELFQRQSERSLTNYLHLIELVLEESHRRSQSTAEILARLDELIERRAFPSGENGNLQRLESEKDAVQLLTMHKSKGLEAAVVFVIGGLYRPQSSPSEPRVYHDGPLRRACLGKPDEGTSALVAVERDQEAQRLLYVAMTRAKARLYLPFLGALPASSETETRPSPRRGGRARPKTGGPKPVFPVSGDYAVLHQRLEALVAGGEVATGGERGRFTLRELERIEPRRRAGATADLDGWRPDPALLEPPPDTAAMHGALRERSAGFVITSYARMKRMEGKGYHAPEGADREELIAETVDAPALEPRDDDPGGTGSGVFLHEVLEALAGEGFRLLRDGEGLREARRFDGDAEVREIVERIAKQNGVSDRYLEAARRMVFAALASPIALGRERLEAVALVDRHVAEMSMLYPIPEASHPSPVLAGTGRPLAIERGLVRGVVDLVFETRGRTFFLDWKSDRLPSFGPEAIADHVDANYALQARLYTLGVIRMLEVADEAAFEARFGGMVYCFLRGMALEGDGQRGVYFARPTWADVVRWDAELRGSDAPFGYRLGAPRAAPRPPERGLR